MSYPIPSVDIEDINPNMPEQNDEDRMVFGFDDEKLHDLQLDVDDDMMAVLNAEQELAEAVEWLNKMRSWYTRDLAKLQEYKSKKGV